MREGSPIGAPAADARKNLLDFAPFSRFLKSRWNPALFQWPVLGVFVLIVYELVLGPSQAHDNLGTALTWILW